MSLEASLGAQRPFRRNRNKLSSATSLREVDTEDPKYNGWLFPS
eukprot:CAMPEP_0203929448 /NCGR_PEP_ID=MMETSP0359-20131031/68380_1 /ASSEMBLY_ACC=CAM_ASM_000338 /TAXON_ID=268821 /ORGANISM="Scrippsiella Hangoei, Strain SHTV-5" /LENGTH=43 /DNA_ID= /DNA_START= /DNA_END= /DNA_ORIENTATION=